MATRLFDIDVCLPELWRLIKAQLADKQDTLSAGTGISIDDNVVSVTLDTTIFKFVSELPDKPDEGDENKIFVVPSGSGETGNEYTEYFWTGSEWEKLGEFKADVDLSDYYTKEETDAAIAEVGDTKQDTLTEGENITISSSNVISATDTGVTEVSVSGGSPLTLEGSITDRTLTITGSVDTYDKATIDDMIKTATAGGITTITATGSDELTLTAEQDGVTVAITGSVDLSSYAKSADIEAELEKKQDTLEPGDFITIENNVISADFVIGTVEEIDEICQ